MLEIEQIYDVAVIGAGPAGSTSARYLAQAGLNVVLLEKEPWPRYKTCGGGLTARALYELPVGIDLPVKHLCHSSTISISHPGLCFTAQRETPILYMIMRDEFDAELVKLAIAAGADFYDDRPIDMVSRDDDCVTIRSGSRITKSRILVAADGVNSFAATELGFMDGRLLAPAIEWEIPVDDQLMNTYHDNALFDFGHLEGGYAWVFPKQGHLSVGLGAIRGHGKGLPQQLTRFLKTHGIPAHKATSRKGQLIPVTPRKGPLAQNRAFLVGDAAGLVDPVTAEGLTYAMQSGRLAAEAIINTDCHPTRGPELYKDKLHSSLLVDIRYGTWLSMLLYSMPKWRNWLFKGHGQRLTERMADLVMGKMNYRDVLWQGSFWLRLLGLK